MAYQPGCGVGESNAPPCRLTLPAVPRHQRLGLTAARAGTGAHLARGGGSGGGHRPDRGPRGNDRLRAVRPVWQGRTARRWPAHERRSGGDPVGPAKTPREPHGVGAER